MVAFLAALSPTTDETHMLVAIEVPRCTAVCAM
jgi:hypothetical protein